MHIFITIYAFPSSEEKKITILAVEVSEIQLISHNITQYAVCSPLTAHCLKSPDLDSYSDFGSVKA